MPKARLFILGLTAAMGASSAYACSPPSSPLSHPEVRQLAREQFGQATYIIDGIALGWSREGLVVSVLRQFKGPRRASLVYIPDQSNSYPPPLGRRVRLLLYGGGKSPLQAFGSNSYDADDPARLERMVDGLIGTPRLPGTYSVAEEYPPPA